MGDQDKKIILKERQAAPKVNPYPWLALLAVPLILALLISMGGPREPVPAEKPPPLNIQPGAAQGSRASAPAVNNPAIAPRAEQAQNQACNFNEWHL